MTSFHVQHMGTDQGFQKLETVSDAKLQRELLEVSEQAMANALWTASPELRKKILENVSDTRRQEIEKIHSSEEKPNRRTILNARRRLLKTVFGAEAVRDEPEQTGKKTSLMNAEGEHGVPFGEALERVRDLLTQDVDPEVKKNTLLALCEHFPRSEQSEERLQKWTRERLKERSEENLILEQPEEQKKAKKILQKLESKNSDLRNIREHRKAYDAMGLIRELLS